MTNSTEDSPQTPAPRGEAAWKAARDGVDARNAAAKKVGKEARDTFEREKEAHRRTVEDGEMKRFLDSRPK
ncbi:MAG: hypothetical protein QOH13_651 [Thermoleophilaceae bacterium]|jgi:hypothetical protein|nr:hypothetical protein [Thermoleophilaceae bacterium]